MDSSSLFTLFFMDSEENVHKILKESYVLDLTGYEIGSILTKGNDGHIRGLERELILDLTKEIEKVIANIRVIRLKTLDIAEIMKLSLSTGLTAYASVENIFYFLDLQTKLHGFPIHFHIVGQQSHLMKFAVENI